jgi:capsular polysaccharide biosynthesis protein
MVDETIPVLLPEEIGNSRQMLESLNIFLGRRPIVWIAKDEYLQVGDLLWAESPVYDAPFSIDPANRLPLMLHRAAMQGYRDTILDYYSAEVAGFTPKERIFLARRPGSSRPYNQHEIQELACHLGFEVVFTEGLTFGQQVALFFHAKYIVGPTGAAFSNLIFATAGLSALRLLGVSEKYENYFSNLATVGGAQIFDCNSDTPEHRLGSLEFQIHQELFEQAMRKLLDQQE